MTKYFQANAVLSKFSRDYMELKKDLPIRPSEMGALNIIAAYDGQATPVMIAELLGVSKPMVAAHVAVLEKKGYITKQSSDKDKRISYLMPTEKAKQLIASAENSINGYLQKIEQALGQEKFELLINLADDAQKVIRGVE